MRTHNRIVAAAFLTAIAVGSSAAFAGADEGMPHDLMAAFQQDEGTPPSFIVALRADEGVPQNLVTG